MVLPCVQYNTTTACIIYIGLLRGINDLNATTGWSLATFSSLCELTMMRLSFLLVQLVRLPNMGFWGQHGRLAPFVSATSMGTGARAPLEFQQFYFLFTLE